MNKHRLVGAMLLLCLLPTNGYGASWSKSYGVSLSGGSGTIPPMIRQAADGGFFLLAPAAQPSSQSRSAPAGARRPGRVTPLMATYESCHSFSEPLAFVVMRTDASGDVQWTQQLQSGPCLSGNDLAAAADGGVFVLGSTVTDPPSPFDLPASVVVKLDAGGNIIWNKVLDRAPIEAFAPRSIKATPDGGALVAAAAIVVKLSTDGDVEFSHHLVNQLNGDILANDVLPASDGYFVTGTGCAWDPESSACRQKGLVARLSYTGALQWANFFDDDLERTVSFLSIHRATSSSIYVDESRVVYHLSDDGTLLWAVDKGRSSSLTGAVDPTGRIWYGWRGTDAGDAHVQTFGIDGSVQEYSFGTPGANESAYFMTGTPLGVATVDASDLGAQISKLDVFDSGCLALTAIPSQAVYPFSPTIIPLSFGISDGGVAAAAFAIGRACLTPAARTDCGIPPAGSARRPRTQAVGCGTSLDFEFASEQKVLIHKYREDDQFLSEYQTRLGADSSIPSADGRIEVRVRLSESGSPVADRNVFFRVIDPPDAADYVRNAAAHHVDDNRDTAFPKGTLEVPAASACEGLPAGSPPCAVSGPDGWARVILKITDRHAGANYHVQASLEPGFPCGNSCAQSGLITAWKRVYLERHRMFRKGAFIRRSVPAGSRQIFISDHTQFQAGDVVELIHSPGLDQRDYAGPLTGTTPGFHFEYGEVQSVQQDPSKPTDWYLLLVNPVTKEYGADYTFGTVVTLSDAVGVVTGIDADDFYTPDDALVASTYRSMYVDVVPAPQTNTEIPFVPNLPQGFGMLSFSQRWFENSRSPMAGSAGTQLLSNHRLLLGAERTPDPVDSNGVVRGALLGLSGQSFWSFVWVARINASVGEVFPCPTAANPGAQCVHSSYGRDPVVLNQETSVHEHTHLWLVNSAATGGHCTGESWRGNGMFCLMHEPFNDPNHNGELDDGITDMHWGADSEYLTVRGAVEPMPQQ